MVLSKYEEGHVAGKHCIYAAVWPVYQEGVRYHKCVKYRVQHLKVLLYEHERILNDFDDCFDLY